MCYDHSMSKLFHHLTLTMLALLFCLGVAQDPRPEDLVGRLLLLSFEGDSAPLEQLTEFTPAGFIYFPSNVTSTQATRTSTQALQNAASYPLLFGIDQEGGPISSYRVDAATLFPGNMMLAATGRPELARAAGEAVGEELAYAGFNLNFAPTVDVNSNPDNPVIGIRSFGEDVNTVSQFASAYLQGLDSAGVAGVAKHFPGHGDTSEDSHLTLPSVTGERARLDSVELPPFRAMVDAGVPGVMTAHVVFPAVEPELPATLSGKALTELLRVELGFGGMVVTDFMDMKAIADNYGPGEAAVQSVVAGADLVMVGSDLETQRLIVTALREAVLSGRLSAQRVLNAVATTEAVAARYRPDYDSVPDYAAHKQLANDIGTAGTTLLYNNGVLPLMPSENVVVIAPQPGGYGDPPHLGEVLARYHPAVSLLRVSEKPSDADVANAVAAAAVADKVVLGSYHWLGEFAPGFNTLNNALVATGNPVSVVALGNPDDMRFLESESAAYLAVYGYREANLEGAARVLTGQVPTGTLPVTVNERYPLGAGLATLK